MTKLYYIYGGIRYSSALYKGEARGRRFCASQSTTRHLTNQVDGIDRLGSADTDRALLLASKTIESRLQTDFSRFFAVPQLDIERFFSNIAHNHNHLELMAPTEIDTSSEMAVDSPHSTTRPAAGQAGRGGRVAGEVGRGRGRRGGRSFKGGRGGNNPADTLAFLKKGGRGAKTNIIKAKTKSAEAIAADKAAKARALADKKAATEA